MKLIKRNISLMAFLVMAVVLVIGINSGKGMAEEIPASLQLVRASAVIQCSGSTFYVDAVEGTDENDGLSPTTAWKSIAKVNQAGLGPGDCVLFKRGQIWREELSINSLNGTSDAPIVFSVYGDGGKPEINGADVVSQWTQHSGNVWRANVPNGSIKGVWFDEQRGEKVDSSSAVSQEGQWFVDGTTVYVYSSGDPSSRYTDPGIEVAQRMTCINDTYNPSSNIVIDNFRLTHNGAVNGFAGAIDARAWGDRFWVIQNVEIDESATMPMMLRGSEITVSNSILTNNSGGLLFHNDSKNNTLEHSEVAYSQSGGVAIYGHGHTVAYSKIHHHRWNGILAWHEPPPEGTPIEENNTSNHVIMYNEIHHNGLGAGEQGDGTQLDGMWVGNMDDSIIAYNLVYDNYHGQGIHLDDGCERNLVANNTIYGHLDNGTIRYSVGIHLEHGYNANNDFVLEHVRENLVVNNNVFNNFMAVSMSGTKGDQSAEQYATNTWSNNNYWIGPEGSHIGWYGPTPDNRGIDTIYLADWQEVTGTDLGSSSVEPMVIDGIPSYQLHEDSPCIDKGVDVGISMDFDGNPVPQGSAPDIGAFEYGSSGLLCDGDLDEDGDYDSADVDLMVDVILGRNSQISCADLDDDGLVSVIDLQMLVIMSLE